ncbi:MAG TPA: methyltransferase domain-containing protein [Polyangiaceae bacterium]|nr:methyltransferase domain-containing protein [Polyangiaceae bacterium]
MPSPLASAPSLEELARLADSAELSDRAFVASILQLRAGSAPSPQVASLYRRVRDAASRAHAGLRARIAGGHFERESFFRALELVPLELRDHWVEEVLGIAYPPLVPQALPRELVTYSPTGMAEVSFLLEQGDLGPGRVLVDLGSGLGKVVLLAALLTGAQAVGIELDAELVAAARAAASALQLQGTRFIQGDLREVPLPEADVYYMFIPLARSSELLQRLEPLARRRRIVLFSQEIDLARAPWLRRTGAGSYWLARFESVAP